jgi:hypothetical protein
MAVALLVLAGIGSAQAQSNGSGSSSGSSSSQQLAVHDPVHLLPGVFPRLLTQKII